MLGHEGGGSYALGETVGDLFTTALGAWLGMITAQANNVAIPRLLRLNGYSDAVLEAPPVLRHGEIERADLSELGQFLQMIGPNQRGAGIQLDQRPDGPLAKALMAAAKLPEPEDAPNNEVSAGSERSVDDGDPALDRILDEVARELQAA